MHSKELSQVFHSFPGLNLLVIGDVMVDAYLFGTVERISPEAPVPVVSVRKRLNRLGGAANVALNLKTLGANPVLCSVIGEDLKGKEFLQLLEEEDISGDHILESKERITTTKFRVIGNNTQMLRVDEELTDELSAHDESRLLDVISAVLAEKNIHAVIFQDYDKGVLTGNVIRQIIDMANTEGIPVVVDPKRRHFMDYTDVALFKPNLKELKEGMNAELSHTVKGSLEDAADYLHREANIRMVMVTLSDAGIFISEQKQDGSIERSRVPAHRRSIADVSGAGDTVVSVAALCLAAGCPALEIASVANLAGGLVCEEVGVVPVDKDRLLAEANKIFGAKEK